MWRKQGVSTGSRRNQSSSRNLCGRRRVRGKLLALFASASRKACPYRTKFLDGDCHVIAVADAFSWPALSGVIRAGSPCECLNSGWTLHFDQPIGTRIRLRKIESN